MVEVFALKLERHIDQKEYHTILPLVSQEKRWRVERFHYFEDVERTLLGDILIRSLIWERLSLPNERILFELNQYGKPSLVNMPSFHFNISHSGNYIVCAVCDSPVGIDVEEIKQIDLKIADRFFTEEEIQYLKACSVDKRLSAFYNVWTKKEAYIKYRSKGMSIPLNSFSVLQKNPRVVIQSVFENDGVSCHVCSSQLTNVLVVNISVNELISSTLKNN